MFASARLNRIVSGLGRRFILAMRGTFLICLGGCIGYSNDFSDSAALRPEPRQPIIGVWSGTWHTDAAVGTVRLSIRPGRLPNEDDATIELTGFNSIGAEWYRFGFAIDSRSYPVREFEVNLPVEFTQNGTCSQALAMQGHVEGNELSIQFWTNDAVEQLDNGWMNLRRLSRAPGPMEMPATHQSAIGIITSRPTTTP